MPTGEAGPSEEIEFRHRKIGNFWKKADSSTGQRIALPSGEEGTSGKKSCGQTEEFTQGTASSKPIRGIMWSANNRRGARIRKGNVGKKRTEWRRKRSYVEEISGSHLSTRALVIIKFRGCSLAKGLGTRGTMQEDVEKSTKAD